MDEGETHRSRVLSSRTPDLTHSALRASRVASLFGEQRSKARVKGQPGPPSVLAPLTFRVRHAETNKPSPAATVTHTRAAAEKTRAITS